MEIFIAKKSGLEATMANNRPCIYQAENNLELSSVAALKENHDYYQHEADALGAIDCGGLNDEKSVLVSEITGYLVDISMVIDTIAKYHSDRIKSRDKDFAFLKQKMDDPNFLQPRVVTEAEVRSLNAHLLYLDNILQNHRAGLVALGMLDDLITKRAEYGELLARAIQFAHAAERPDGMLKMGEKYEWAKKNLENARQYHEEAMNNPVKAGDKSKAIQWLAGAKMAFDSALYAMNKDNADFLTKNGSEDNADFEAMSPYFGIRTGSTEMRMSTPDGTIMAPASPDLVAASTGKTPKRS